MRVLLAALRAIQACCVAAGFVKYVASQEIACELVYGGMAALVGLLANETEPALVRAECAHVLGCVALGEVDMLPYKTYLCIYNTCYHAFSLLCCAILFSAVVLTRTEGSLSRPGARSSYISKPRTGPKTEPSRPRTIRMTCRLRDLYIITFDKLCSMSFKLTKSGRQCNES